MRFSSRNTQPRQLLPGRRKTGAGTSERAPSKYMPDGSPATPEVTAYQQNRVMGFAHVTRRARPESEGRKPTRRAKKAARRDLTAAKLRHPLIRLDA